MNLTEASSLAAGNVFPNISKQSFNSDCVLGHSHKQQSPISVIPQTKPVQAGRVDSNLANLSLLHSMDMKVFAKQ